MGSCVSQEFFTSAQKEYSIASHTNQPGCPPPTPHGSQQVPAAALEKDNSKENQLDFCWDPLQKCFKTSNGILSDSKSGSSAYNVTALATSSLVGLVQTVKDHITKPTAMARGRVAHLIEWKGWSAPQAGWEPWLTNEEHYSYLTDELKEARFAAGVAEQFAITEATLSTWSSLDDGEMDYGGSFQEIIQLQGSPSASPEWQGRKGALDVRRTQQLQPESVEAAGDQHLWESGVPDLETVYLQEKLLPRPPVISNPNLEGSLPAHSSSTHTSPTPQVQPGVEKWNSAHLLPGPPPCDSPWTGSSQADSLEKEPACVGGEQEGLTSVRQKRLSNSLHYVDSSSLSEDEVFYN